MNMGIIILIVLAFLFLLAVVFILKKKRPQTAQPFAASYREVLNGHVIFYKELNGADKIEFEKRMQIFLSNIKITGVNTMVEDIDKVLIAAGAIIPIFAFPDWEYMNLYTILLYPGAFDEFFNQEGADRNKLGLIGTGPYQNMMVLSKQGLRDGFKNTGDRNNTAIHEFVHLIDKTDGAIDGVPEFLMSKQYILRWLNLMQKEMQQIITNRSDINPYGATNQAEFFAVVSEYFFERPDLLERNHPELYNLLSIIFRQQPKNSVSSVNLL
jgi:Mlc titration factor MtfA (ptsG expression regulator)